MSGRGGGRRFRRIRAGVLLCAALSCAWLAAVAGVDSCDAPDTPATPALASNDATLEFERGSEFAARGEFAQALPAYEASRSLAEADGNARLAALATANAARTSEWPHCRWWPRSACSASSSGPTP